MIINSLMILNISYTRIDKTTGKGVIDVLQYNKRLKIIDISGNGLDNHSLTNIDKVKIYLITLIKN